jgi:hypothetical protein
MEKDGKQPASDKEAKLAEALRANLRRRKVRIVEPQREPRTDGGD